MKKTFILSLVLFLFAGVKAQTVTETIVNYQNLTIPAYQITLKQSKDNVNGAFNQRIKEAGLKTSRDGNHIAVIEQIFREIYNQPVDFIARIEDKSTKEETSTVVTFFAKSPNLTISQSELNINVRRFAEQFGTYVERYVAQQKMGAEEKNLKKAQKEQSKAIANAASLDKDIASYQSKIAKKEAEIAKYQAKIDACNADIEKIKASMEKKLGKKVEADEKVNKANTAVQSSQDEVDKYKQQAGTPTSTSPISAPQQ